MQTLPPTSFLFRILVLLSVVELLAGCGETAKVPPTPVIGVEGAEIYDRENLVVISFFHRRPDESFLMKPVEAGTKLTVISKDGEFLEVKTSSGDQGWVLAYLVCSLTEFERRKSTEQIPKTVMCIKSKGDGASFYRGSVSIVDGQLVAKPGDAFWMDTTMKGKEFSFGSQKVAGDPTILLLTSEAQEMSRLPIWDPEGVPAWTSPLDKE